MENMYNLAIVGATGAVGKKLLQVLNERNFPIRNIHFFASSRSEGKTINFQNKNIVVETIKESSFQDIDIVFCSATNEISKKIGPMIRNAKSILIDDSSVFRMDDDVPLIVPEINPEDIDGHTGIMSIPNCTTTPLVMVLNALKEFAKIVKVNVSTYQAVSGAGSAAINELNKQLEEIVQNKKPTISVFTHQIALNAIPQVDIFEKNNYTKEEMKIVNESRKILHEDMLPISATCVRIPTAIGHCESVSVEFDEDIDLSKIIDLLSHQSGLIISDLDDILKYPTPLNTENDHNVYIGRIREDLATKKGLLFWIVADNLLKGAATNAVQIAETVILRKKIQARI
jgi:aspartate-semialdehyde dehydrogenase